MTSPSEDPKFALQLLDPSPGRFVANVMVSAVGLVLIVFVHGMVEGQAFSAERLLRLIPLMFGLSTVLWGVPTGIRMLRDRRSPPSG